MNKMIKKVHEKGILFYSSFSSKDEINRFLDQNIFFETNEFLSFFHVIWDYERKRKGKLA